MIRNIVICTTQVPFTSGGGESHVAGLKQALCEAGYNAEVVALPFKWYPPSEIMRGALAWRLLDLSQANGKPIDLVIGMKFPAYLVAHERKVLWIMHQHRSAYNLWGTAFDDLSTYPDGTRLREWIRHCDGRFIPEAKKVFANSKTVADRLRRYNQIESEPLYHPPPHFKQLRTGEQGDYVFYPSRLEPQKRQHLLIEAMRFVQTPIKAVLAGGARDLKEYESLIRQHGVGDRIKLPGFVSDAELVELYANALGVCYLPFDEDYGYVTFEGMLSGKPILVPKDGGGATEFIEHEQEGFIVEPEPQAIAECLDRLYSNRQQARAMGDRGREKVLSLNLSWEHVVNSLISAAL
ncbi:MAG TPA: glycosyltransferase family 4 protein [Pyrinomonadaceae bacterium]|nr:glycosyltransferase family 4 protein [Pyrinomonadaceae bacterium]